MRAKLVLGFSLVPSIVLACVAIGDHGPIAVAGEEALIVWDEAAKTEHFIRRASFKDPPVDFGFLVPTPSKPQLNEAAAIVFDRLYDMYKAPPPKDHARNVIVGPQPAAAMAPPVRVVAQQVVAGLDATVLLATDPKALAAWLSAHKYPSSSAIETWLAPYVKKGAYITAFKLAGASSSSGTVRMSFTTDAPVFPYSEPAGKQMPRPFRVSVVAPTKMIGMLDDKPWGARVAYAAPLSEHDARELLDGVTPRNAQKDGFITTFDEPSSARGAVDLVFRADKNNRRVAPSLTTAIAP